MTVFFTDEEKKWLDTEAFNWHVKDGAPDKIRKSLEQKLKLIKEADNPKNWFK